MPTQITDNAGVLSRAEVSQVQSALDSLYDDKRVKLWVVFVDSFDGANGVTWAQNTMRLSGFGDDDALLAVAVTDREYAFQVPSTAGGGVYDRAADVRRNDIEPALRQNDWAAAAIGAADGLNGGGIAWSALLVVLGVVVVLCLVLWAWSRRRNRKRRKAEFAAAQRVDATDPNALAGVPLDALDDLSKTIVVDVDNAVRTSEGELALAAEEFGATQTAPFAKALENAKAALAQAFNVRQTLDDAIPESPLQRRELLTRVIVAAARADRELEAQCEAFEQLRDLLINAPTRLDALTQQMVALTARLEPSTATLTQLRQQYSETALTAVAGNIDVARQRLTFADQSITTARALVARPAGDQTGLIDAIHAAESALGQAQTLLDAIESAATDISRAINGLPAAIADIEQGIDAATAQLREPHTPRATELAAARDAAAAAVEHARTHSDTDPLGAFTRLTKADAELDALLVSVDEQRLEARRQAQLLEQALFTAQSRVKAVSDFIDTRRGSIGPEARTRLSEAGRQLDAAQAKRTTAPAEAIAHANGAAALAAQAQSLANNDVQNAQMKYSGHYGGGGTNDLGAVIGGILIGNVLRGGFSGGWGSSGAATAVSGAGSAVAAAWAGRRRSAARHGRRAATTPAAAAGSSAATHFSTGRRRPCSPQSGRHAARR
ncbi:TPM domain-containing protein [Mycolicibacterium mengxianglii]|uniref:TPM domain-containing protein n=1 Tax=Mycolicibacterium mengxianglii TaxID=2736649 RepID=UPI002FCAD08C